MEAQISKSFTFQTLSILEHSCRTYRRACVRQPAPGSLACNNTFRCEKIETDLTWVNLQDITLSTIRRAIIFLAGYYCLSEVPHRPAELLIGHTAVIFLLSPQLSHGFGFEKTKHPVWTILPFDKPGVTLRVQQDVSDKLPQVRPAWVCRSAQMWEDAKKKEPDFSVLVCDTGFWYEVKCRAHYVETL